MAEPAITKKATIRITEERLVERGAEVRKFEELAAALEGTGTDVTLTVSDDFERWMKVLTIEGNRIDVEPLIRAAMDIAR